MRAKRSSSAHRQDATFILDCSETSVGRELPEDFLSLTIDTSLILGGHWWGSSKGTRAGVSKERATALDLGNRRLRAYARALAPAMLRVGGTEADRVRYKVGKKLIQGALLDRGSAAEADESTHQFVLKKKLWKDIHTFAESAAFRLLFTLSAGPADRDAERNWREDNARRLIAYTARKGYSVAAWELGNEVNGFPFIHGLRHRVSGRRYARDFERFGRMARAIDPDAMLVGPASAIWPRIGEPNPLIRALCASSASAFLDAVSWHYYPQQSTHGRIATRRANKRNMLSPQRLDEAALRNDRIRRSISLANATRAAAGAPPTENWVTETAHALYGGEKGLSDTFVSTLWWLDELGLFAREGVDKVFRQALIGARYGLLDERGLDPRPDYFASFLWKKLMGRRVLSNRMESEAGRKLRVYLHAGTGESAHERTILLINLSRVRSVSAVVKLSLPEALPDSPVFRVERYLLEGEGTFASRTMLVNGVRAGDDLIFSWDKKKTRKKYGLAPTVFHIAPGENASLVVELPKLSAIFLRVETLSLPRPFENA